MRRFLDGRSRVAALDMGTVGGCLGARENGDFLPALGVEGTVVVMTRQGRAVPGHFDEALESTRCEEMAMSSYWHARRSRLLSGSAEVKW